MSNSSANAPAVDSSSIHKFPYKWWMKDLAKVPKNGLTVFSCFSCGGGSSMGYKLAGYDVIGNVEIDPKVNKVYQENNHPRYSYLMDVRKFLEIPNEELPKELFHLDILDGSPPCSVFSTAGAREKGWGKEKVFKEGQAKQRLDDLFIYFIQIAQKLQPRVVVAENVSGLIKGNAKGYVNEIFKAFDMAGYNPQLFLLDARYMGVPQKRQRTVFIAQRKDQGFPKMTLSFKEPPILFGEVRSEHGEPLKPNTELAKWVRLRKSGDLYVGMTIERLGRKKKLWSSMYYYDERVAYTLTTNEDAGIRMVDGERLSILDQIACSTFPQDYEFGDQKPRFIMGMSVPPVMMAQIASEIHRQWFSQEEQ